MSSTRPRAALLAGAAFASLMISIPIVTVSSAPAAAQQASISVQFRTALEPYGKWHRHKRWGEVWVPARVSNDWRPYTRGRWVYSDDYGWYWVSAAEEAEWGWVAFHYGRWVNDDEYGWVWIPGNEWGPAWVDWRRGGDYVGWAPLPPEEIVVAYRDEPDYWTFVRPRDLVAPRINVVILPARQRDVYIRNTVVVNTTVVVRDRRFAVNPGIPPAYIAAAYGRPIKTFTVRPRVLAGTARIDGAIEVTGDDLRRRGERRGRRGDREVSVVQESKTVIRPAKEVPKAQALGAKEQGRLGDDPPKAARGETVGAPATAGRPAGGAAKDAAEDRTDTARDAAKSAPDAGKAATTQGRDPAHDGKGAKQDDKRPAATERQERAPDQRRGAANRDERPGRRDASDRGAADKKATDRDMAPRRTTGQGPAQSSPDDKRRDSRSGGRERPERGVDAKPQASPAPLRGPRGEERSERRSAPPPAAAQQRGPSRTDRPAAAARPSPPAAAQRPERPAPAARAPQAAPAPAARAPQAAPAPAARAPQPAPAPAARAPQPAPAPAARAPRPQPSTTGAGPAGPGR
jgi:hypothetical protein